MNAKTTHRFQSAGRVGILLSVLLSAGCAASSDQLPQNAGADRSRDVFGVGYDGLSDYYIDRVDMRKLALHGLNGLKTIDPAFAFTADDRQVVLAAGRPDARPIPMPTGDDPHRWARFTSDVVAESRVRFAPLKDASSEAIYKAVRIGQEITPDLYEAVAEILAFVYRLKTGGLRRAAA